jgi:hypothetical protein
MTPDFLAGIIVALLPSMLLVAWLVWQQSHRIHNSVN